MRLACYPPNNPLTLLFSCDTVMLIPKLNFRSRVFSKFSGGFSHVYNRTNI